MRNRISSITKEIGRLRRRVGMDFHSFREFYFSHYHTIKEGVFQREISDILIDITKQRGARIAIAAPRGFGKSTIVNLEYIIYCVCYKKEDFIVLLSSTAEQAKVFLRHIKQEFETNQRLREDFPDVCDVRKKIPPVRWTQGDIVTNNNVQVLALGTGQNLRGRRHGEHRPTLITLDDLETDEAVQNPDSFHKLEDWLTKAVLKAGSKKTNAIYVGTLHHPASLLAKFTDPKQSPGWESRIYKTILSFADRADIWEKWERIVLRLETYNGEFGMDAAYKYYKKHETTMLKGSRLLWPEFKSYYELMVIRVQEGSSSFDCEMQNDPVNPRDCHFSMKEIHYWEDNFDSEEHLLASMKDEILFYASCDPSLGKEGKRGDYSAIMVVAWNPERGKIYVLEADVARRSPDKTIEDIIAHHMKREIIRFGFETNQFQELMAKDIIRRANERCISVRLKEIQNRVDKLARIESLQALIKSGVIQFSRKHTLLLEQLKYFPKGLHDDALDALEMVAKICYKPPSVIGRDHDES